MVQTRAEPTSETASVPKRRSAWPRDVAFGILVAVVASGLLWLVIAIVLRQLAP